MDPRLWVSEITFSDGNTATFENRDVVVIVGPNNAGKSAALRAIRDWIATNQASRVLKKLTLGKSGTADQIVAWLSHFTREANPDAPDPTYQALGANVTRNQARGWWASTGSGPLHGLARLFCHLLSGDERLLASSPAPSLAVFRDPPTHPLHYVYRDESLERRLSSQFRQAFGVDLVVNRAGGSQIPLHVGDRPIPGPGQDRLSLEYLEAVAQLPLLHEQGDGMRSFASVILHASVGQESILLVDEPEAFLHPPQARQLGRNLLSDQATGRQLFIATHSGDVLRGMLDSGSSAIRVVRIRREGNVNRIRELDNTKITELWGDPLLRYSNILDGLFHESVVVCEADADARFYAAMVDAVLEAQGPATRRPDVMFTHCGGKDRLSTVIRALRGVDVPVSVAVDFDVLNSEHPLRAIVESAGGLWSEVESDWRQVKSAVDSKKPEWQSADVVAEIKTVLAEIKGAVFPETAQEAVRKILRRSSPWATAKEVGRSFVPSGQPTQAYVRMMKTLWGLRIHVVEVGELEGFARSVGNHGPKWVNEVLKRNLASDPELEPARQFAMSLVG